ncbi:MAG: MFS transporter [Methylibium sp. NZG]|nr:MAG: MFS transporter [Methylibium sp. NZG]
MSGRRRSPQEAAEEAAQEASSVPAPVPAPAAKEHSTLVVAAALALAATVSLGLARFSYALLLPPMRADLGWSYLTSGTMNTVNAAGYLVGALLAPRWLARHDPRAVMLAGMAATALLLAGHGLVLHDAWLYALRALSGAASAAAFVGGGLLAARLVRAGSTAVRPELVEGLRQAQPEREGGARKRAPVSAGLVLGLYYGGTGVGIIASAVLVPPLTALAYSHAWQWAWLALAALALLATGVTAAFTRHIAAPRAAAAQRAPFDWRPLAFGLAGYFMFGLGYIGYMTFVVTLLRENGMGGPLVTAFYALIGLGVIGSSWWWAGMLQRFRGGESLAVLNGLLALATLLPVLSAQPVVVFASGALFGGVFLSVVASTTAMVRHNLPEAAWPAGIAAFTIVFAAGQIVGPALVGWVADGPGGLARGFACSAAVLALGALLAWRQRPVASPA